MTFSRGAFLASLTITSVYNTLFDPTAANPWSDPFLGHSILWVCLGIGACHLTSDHRCVTLKDLAMAIPALLGSIALSSTIGWFGLAVTLFCFISRSTSGQFRTGALICVAAALHEPVIQFVGYTIGDRLLSLDQAMLSATMPLMRSMIPFFGVATDASSTPLLLVWGCTSLNNVSLALLLWSTIVYTVIHQVPPRIWAYGLLLAAMMVVINVGRLLVMSIDIDHYRLLHDDPTGNTFRLVTLISILLIIAISTSHASRINNQRL